MSANYNQNLKAFAQTVQSSVKGATKVTISSTGESTTYTDQTTQVTRADSVNFSELPSLSWAKFIFAIDVFVDTYKDLRVLAIDSPTDTTWNPSTVGYGVKAGSRESGDNSTKCVGSNGDMYKLPTVRIVSQIHLNEMLPEVITEIIGPDVDIDAPIVEEV